MENPLITGHLKITSRNSKTGEERVVVDKPNLVVSGTQGTLVGLLANDDVDNSQMWSIGIGDGSDAPAITDTGLRGSNTFTKQYDSMTTTPADGEIELSMTVLTSEGNPTPPDTLFYTEAGVFTKGGTLLSRQLHAAVEKTSSVSLEYKWRFQISIS